MRTVTRLHVLLFGLAPLAACADAAPTDPTGPAVAVRIAPLSLPEVGIVCYDLAVTSAGGPVWSQGSPGLTALGHDQTAPPDATLAATTRADATTVCSDRYGNGPGGGITYIGPCDASPEADTVPGGTVQNRVTLWVDGLYDEAGAAELGDWQDPCPNGCSLEVDCNPNADSPADFDLTIMRRAEQGFFDVIVDFDDIFCSAKLDTCYDDEPIRLLHGADDERDWSAVFGLACTGGTDAVATTLHYTRVFVMCDDFGQFELDLSVDSGNTSVTVDDVTLNYAVYRDLEALDCGSGAGSCKKAYWNFALSLDDLRALNSSCSLVLAATASDGEGFEGGVPAGEGLAYPYIEVLAQLTVPGPTGSTQGIAGCQQNALDGDDSAVVTEYRGQLEGLEPPPDPCYEFDGEVRGSAESCPTYRYLVSTCFWTCRQDNGAGSLVTKQCLCASGPGMDPGSGMIIPGTCNIANCANVISFPPNWSSSR